MHEIKNSFHILRSRKAIERAWRQVRQNGIKSKSPEIRDEIYRFDDQSQKNINSIAGRINKKTFRFAPALGIEKERDGKAPRPIVLAPIENRIVQRALLDILQKNECLKKYVNSPNSFGGQEGKSVKDALTQVQKKIREGCLYYAKTDISDFFTRIPKKPILEIISSSLKNDDFMAVLQNSMDVELSNLAELKYHHRFPTQEIGVAQGCALSAYFGNILLNAFDIEYNLRGITCLRYIDDLLFLGKAQASVRKVFENAQRFLADLGLSLSQGKTDFGHISRPFEFLGWSISVREIQPSQGAIDRLIKKIDSEFRFSLGQLSKDPQQALKKKKSFAQTIDRVNGISSGWAYQYRFCTNWQIMRDIDSQIDYKIKTYYTRYQQIKDVHLRKISDKSHVIRNMLGIMRISEIDPHSLSDQN